MTMRDFIAALELLDECRAEVASVNCCDQDRQEFIDGADKMFEKIDTFLDSVGYDDLPALKDLAPEVTA